MSTKSYSCQKCGNKKADIDNIRTTGSGFTRYFNIQNRRFIAVSCSRCGFTELYKAGPTTKASNVLDFITG